MIPNSFFAEQGLTATSANHIANLAKEYVKSLEQDLHNISFYNTSLTIIGSDTRQQVHSGWTLEEMETISTNLELISQSHSLIAWLREAIKAQEAMLTQISGITVTEYCTEKGIELPEKPSKRSSITKDEYISQLTVKERNKILSLQAKAAVYGKFIHPEGDYANARKELMNKVSNSTQVKESGRDTLLYYYQPTVSVTEVDNMFYALQQKHRETQAELNGYLHKIEVAVEEDAAAKTREYTEAAAEYNAQISQLIHAAEVYKEEKLNAARKLRITIPNELKAIYTTINSLHNNIA